MKTEMYCELIKELEDVVNKLENAKAIIREYSEHGDITNALNISRVTLAIRGWISLLKEWY